MAEWRECRGMEEEFEIYAGFAEVYDEFMDNIPYDEWHLYLHELLMEYGITSGIVAELACGTGSMTCRLAEDGYDMIGIDISEDMLEVARNKCGADVLLLQQDMRELDLYGTAAAMVCVCDGMNYITEKEELKKVFENVKTFLDYDGIFIFDMKTEHFYKDIIGECVIADNRENASIIWDNKFHEDTRINEYLLTIYNLEDEENDLFARYDEMHYQKAYSIEEVSSLIEEAGLKLLNVYNAFTKDKPDKDSERVYFVAKRERMSK